MIVSLNDFVGIYSIPYLVPDDKARAQTIITQLEKRFLKLILGGLYLSYITDNTTPRFLSVNAIIKEIMILFVYHGFGANAGEFNTPMGSVKPNEQTARAKYDSIWEEAKRKTERELWKIFNSDRDTYPEFSNSFGCGKYSIPSAF